MSQILDGIGKLQRVGNTHRDLKPDNIFLTGGADGVAIADFGELGDVQLRFTKGTTQAGGAPGFIAPDVLAAIERMADGATATTEIYTLSLHDALPIPSKICDMYLLRTIVSHTREKEF